MAPTPLATLPDAIRLGYTLTAGQEESLLARASARLRRAAGQQISSTTSTVRLPVENGTIRLPGAPITAVASVVRLAEDGGAAVTGWRWNGRERIDYVNVWPTATPVYFFDPWQCLPVDVLVTYTHGLAAPYPDELVELACSVAQRLGASSTATGMEAGIRSEQIDDYSVTYAAEARVDAAGLLPGERSALHDILGAPPAAYVVRPR